MCFLAHNVRGGIEVFAPDSLAKDDYGPVRVTGAVCGLKHTAEEWALKAEYREVVARNEACGNGCETLIVIEPNGIRVGRGR
jgi:hypothetical protein